MITAMLLAAALVGPPTADQVINAEWASQPGPVCTTSVGDGVLRGPLVAPPHCEEIYMNPGHLVVDLPEGESMVTFLMEEPTYHEFFLFGRWYKVDGVQARQSRGVTFHGNNTRFLGKSVRYFFAFTDAPCEVRAPKDYIQSLGGPVGFGLTNLHFDMRGE